MVWLLMSWIIVSPGHQKPYRLCRINTHVFYAGFVPSHCWKRIWNQNSFIFPEIRQEVNNWEIFISLPHTHTLTHTSAAYMRRWTGSVLYQIMACACLAPTRYLNQHWFIVNYTLRNKLQWNLNQNTTFFIHEIAFETIVCEMVAILSMGEMS